MKTKNIALPFVVLTIGITWLLWWGIVIANQFGFLEYGTPMMMVLYMIAGNIPPIVAIVLILKSKQMTVKKLAKTIFDFKQSILFYIGSSFYSRNPVISNSGCYE